MKKLNISNKRFGRLIAIKSVGIDKTRHLSWLCKCDCGEEIIVSVSMLSTGNTKSCGCNRFGNIDRNVLLPKGEASFNQLYATYKNGAKRRGIEFVLTKIQFKEIVQGKCYYCGIKPYQVYKERHCNGDYIYNGIDRINNELGYVDGNCVSSCGICNSAKGKRNQKYFFDWVKKVYRTITTVNPVAK